MTKSSKQPDVSTGYHLFKDGNAWCAVGPNFVNLQESDAGFGDTPERAFNAWRYANRNNISPDLMPVFADFKLHDA